MGMTVSDIATVCRSRSNEEERHSDEAQAYGYVASYVEERSKITLEQLAHDLDLWIRVHKRSIERSRAQGSTLHTVYKQQADVYQEVLSWAKGERSVKS
ncbi:hypothetical protein KSF_109670 [Reticulibacter mediterranei]|uniref:Uncharacterized protein n=1 Tax=Reticulibacter mediterranei TaxID=2778369 RepID=A0A8J3IRW0_9CHLR|nr:hypothetical protein [Reticulibacter mediterranei]GHP00920.1 hypothetical protein KSF_109670 [Reticulibacter mediterranei]